MNEWTVYLTLASLAGTFALVVRPVIGLTQAITRLTTTVDSMSEELDRVARKNSDSHRRLWAHAEEQDARLCAHEKRLDRLGEGASCGNG